MNMTRSLFWLMFLGTSFAQTTVFQIHGLPSELSSTMNGATVTPALGPTGKLALNGAGSIVFAPLPATAPGTAGTSSVSFLNCCAGTNNAYYQFTGVSTVFVPSAGQVTFWLTSRYNLAQRVAAGSRFDYVFDAQDATGKHQYGFFIQGSAGSSSSAARLSFNWSTGAGTSAYWYIPSGTEDAVFGAGHTIKIMLAWTGSTFSMSLNDKLMKSSVYTAPATVSVLNIGSQAFQGKGGYNSLDDFLSEFQIGAASPPPPPPPTAIAPAFTSAASATFTGGSASTFAVTASGTPAPSLSVVGALPGMTFDPSTGVLSGIPTAVGVYSLSLTAANSAGTATQALAVTVNSPPTAPVSCTGTYDSTKSIVSLTCPGTSLISPTAFSNISVVISLSGTAAQWQIDNRKYLVAFGSNPPQ